MIRDREVKHGSEDEGRFSGAEGEGDVKSQDKAENVGSIMDESQIDDRLFGMWKVKLMGWVVVLAVLVGEFKLGSSFLSQLLFPVVQFMEVA